MRMTRTPMIVTMLIMSIQPAVAQDSPVIEQAFVPKLQTVVSDDFRQDTRRDYQIEGDVDWREGSLTLESGSSITRAINGGAWVHIDLQLENPPPTSENQEHEIQVRFLLEEGKECFAQLRLPSEQGGSTAALIDLQPIIDESDSQEQNSDDGGQEFEERLVRELPLSSSRCAKLNMSYRFGLVRVAMDQSNSFAAHIENGSLQVDAVSIKVLGRPAVFTSFSVNATNRVELISGALMNLSNRSWLKRRLLKNKWGNCLVSANTVRRWRPETKHLPCGRKYLARTIHPPLAH